MGKDLRVLEVGVYSQRLVMGNKASKVVLTPPKPAPYSAPESLAEFPELKTAVEAAVKQPSVVENMNAGLLRYEAFEKHRQLEHAAGKELGKVWETANEEDRKMLLVNVPQRIVDLGQGYYGVPGSHTTSAEHGGRRRKTRKHKRLSRKTRRSRK